jgi:K+-sensing histidine kinase KdpD
MASTLDSRWERLTGEQRHDLLRGIVHDADRMNAVLRELVDAARLAANRLEISPESVDLEEVVAGVIRWMGANPNRPAVAWEGEADKLLADPERLRGALTAMAEAAAWHGREGDVRIQARDRGEVLEIEVFRASTDLTSREAMALLEPRGAGSGGGSKLGLFVARGVAEAHAGSLRADAEGGIRFVLRLPVR